MEGVQRQQSGAPCGSGSRAIHSQAFDDSGEGDRRILRFNSDAKRDLSAEDTVSLIPRFKWVISGRENYLFRQRSWTTMDNNLREAATIVRGISEKELPKVMPSDLNIQGKSLIPSHFRESPSVYRQYRASSYSLFTVQEMHITGTMGTYRITASILAKFITICIELPQLPQLPQLTPIQSVQAMEYLQPVVEQSPAPVTAPSVSENGDAAIGLVEDKPSDWGWYRKASIRYEREMRGLY